MIPKSPPIITPLCIRGRLLPVPNFKSIRQVNRVKERSADIKIYLATVNYLKKKKTIKPRVIMITFNF